MKPVYAGLLALAIAAGCNGTNPLTNPDDGSGGGGGGGGSTPPPTTDVGSGAARINEDADLYTVSQFAYDPGTDTLTVRGLPFDGADAYQRDATITLGPNAARRQFAVYKADPTTLTDPYDGGTITQDNYIAVRGEHASGRSRVTVVRSGAYYEYGYGAWEIERDSGVTLPSSSGAPATGQANYEGNYAGLRTFQGNTGIELTDGDMVIEIDFSRLGDRGAVRGAVTNRNAYDESGTLVTALPNIVWVVEPYSISANGRIDGANIMRYIPTGSAAPEVFEGTYTALMLGDDAEEIVGTLRITSNGRITGVTGGTYDVETEVHQSTEEVGGFVLER